MALNGSAGAFVLQQGEAATLVFLSSSEADVITASTTGQASYTTAICVAFNGKNQWGDIASLPHRSSGVRRTLFWRFTARSAASVLSAHAKRYSAAAH